MNVMDLNATFYRASVATQHERKDGEGDKKSRRRERTGRGDTNDRGEGAGERRLN